MSRISREAAARFALRSLTAGIFLLAAGLLLSQHIETLQWPSTLGTVERVVLAPASDPDDSRSPGERFRPQVSYTYEVDGKTYTAEHVAVFDWIYRDRRRASEYLQQFDIAARNRVPVYYDPENPEEAILIRHIPWRRLEVMLALLVLVILPVSVVAFSLVDLIRGGRSREGDHSRGRFW
ncbi:MAG: DUF3592 domain-containing protein [Alkalispirochaeta sp.]